MSAPFPRLARIVFALAGALALIASVALAQPQWERGWSYRWVRVPPRFPTSDSFDGAFNFCRVMYESTRREDGGMGWWTDYPSADVNLSIRLAELTKTRISRDKAGEPNHLVVRLTDDELFQCPFAILEDAGTASLDELEVERLRTYLLKGGFLWVDDFWGTAAWENWVREIRRVLPQDEFPIVDVPRDHAIFRTLFEVGTVPQIPSIQFWRRSGGDTSERGSDSSAPEFRGIGDGRGRLIVVMTHNTDIADAWEREGEERDYFYRFSVDGYAVGINVLLYAMTH